jgi:hypothetical protein
VGVHGSDVTNPEDQLVFLGCPRSKQPFALSEPVEGLAGIVGVEVLDEYWDQEAGVREREAPQDLNHAAVSVSVRIRAGMDLYHAAKMAASSSRRDQGRT